MLLLLLLSFFLIGKRGEHANLVTAVLTLTFSLDPERYKSGHKTRHQSWTQMTDSGEQHGTCTVETSVARKPKDPRTSPSLLSA